MTGPGSFGVTRKWSRAKRFGVTALVVAGTIVSLIATDLLFHVRPIVAEKFWLAALASGIAPLQQEAIGRLRDHPTRAAALSLVAFINAKTRTGDFRLAQSAADTLRALSGRTFEAGEWPEVLARINHWAERALAMPR